MSHPSEAEGKIRKELVTGNLFVITKKEEITKGDWRLFEL